VKIDLANIAGTPGARGRYPVSERLAPTDDCSFVEPVTGELSVENTSSLLLVRGQLRAVLRLTCARCLTEVEHPLEVEVAEEFATEGTAPGVETIDRDEPEASAISDYVLDLSEFVRQHVAVHLPMAFLCRPDCLGICPSCGRNLNESPCGCQAEPADERWEKLRELALKAPEPKAGPGQR
jgi:uncharacterized protein